MRNGQALALFCGADHLTRGGMDDYHSSYATLEEALAAAMNPNLTGLWDSEYPERGYRLLEHEWYEIADVRTMQVVANGDGPELAAREKATGICRIR